MSSRQYTVTVKLKDDGLLKKLEGVSGGGGGKTGGGSGVFAGGGDIFKRLESLGVGQLAKLTGIGIGVGSLVALTIKSSAMLQGTFKLWESGMNLIFKPIGDFFALALRPITQALLQQMIVPFYKTVYPWFRDVGKKLGDAIPQMFPQLSPKGQQVSKDQLDSGSLQVVAMGMLGPMIETSIKTFTKNVEQGLKDAPNTIANTYLDFNKKLDEALGGVPGHIVERLTEFGNNVGKWLADVPSMLLGKFLDLGMSISNHLISLPSVLLDGFLQIGKNIWDGLISVPGAIADVFTGLATDITSALAGIPGAIYNAIMGWINDLKTAAGLGGGPAPDTGSRFPQGNTRQRVTIAGVADAVGFS